jgi:3-hydroxybutyryl-CoA dehydratase
LNHYIYDEIALGHTESFSVTITEQMMASFFEVTGDLNPLHTNRDYANSTGRFADKVVYGMLTASFLSTLAGTYLPGKYCLIHKTEAEFPSPVYVGDVITFFGEVIRKDDNFKTVELKVTAKNNDNIKVLRGKMRIGVLK